MKIFKSQNDNKFILRPIFRNVFAKVKTFLIVTCSFFLRRSPRWLARRSVPSRKAWISIVGNTKGVNKEVGGFTFIEVIIAITIVGLILTSLFGLQTTMFKNIINGHFRTSRLFFLKNFLLDEDNLKKAKKEKKVIERDLTDPKMKMKYELKKVDEKSNLVKNFKNVSLIKVTGTWQGLRAQQEESFIRLVYIKPEKKTQKTQGDRSNK